jgi:hypothetical protein
LPDPDSEGPDMRAHATAPVQGAQTPAVIGPAVQER